MGPFCEEDVQLSLQLLAYLSKYPHVQQGFYEPRVSFHPATAALYGNQNQAGADKVGVGAQASVGDKANGASLSDEVEANGGKDRDLGFFRTITG